MSRYVIFGAGGIGSAIGAGLFQAGLPVVLIARGRHLEVLQQNGLTYEHLSASHQLRIPVAASLSEANVEEGDTVLLCMKSQDALQAIHELARTAKGRINVVCAQNGVDNERSTLRFFQHVYGLVVRIPAIFTEPGRVSNRARPTGGILDIGRYPAGSDDVARRIAADLVSAGFDSRAQDDIMRWKYGKLLDNLATPIDALFGPSQAKAEIIQLAQQEAAKVLSAAGIKVATAAEKAERRKAGMDYDPRKDPDRPGGSVWQSLKRGTGSVEVDYLSGEIVLLGRLHDVPTPVNDAVQRLTGRLAHEGGTPSQLDAAEFLQSIEVES